MLGEMLQPWQSSEEPDSLRQKWDGFMSNPVNRSFMMGTGLQLMAGGHGNAAQQLAVALGQGAQSAGNVEKEMVGERDKERALEEKDTDRQLKRDLNAETQAAKIETANLRGQYAAENASLRNNNQLLKDSQFIAAVQKQMQVLDPYARAKTPEQQAELEKKALEIVQRLWGAKAGGPGAGGPANGAAKTSDKKAAPGAPPVQSQPPKAGEKPAEISSPGKGLSPGKVDSDGKMEWSEFARMNPNQVIKVLNNPRLHRELSKRMKNMPPLNSGSDMPQTPEGYVDLP